MINEIDSAGTVVPARRGRWPWHIIVGAAVVLAVGGLLAASAGELLRPTAEVRVAPVVFDRSAPPAAIGTTSSARGTTVQAPGWLEADPYFVACTALADGVVAEMLVLEGERVERDQVVARLVTDDAALALARAEADLEIARAELGVAEADLAAARTDWEHLVERERAVGVANGALAEIDAELLQLPALVEQESAMLERLEYELGRSRDAFESGAASDFEVIILEKRVKGQAAAVDALRRRDAILAGKRERLAAEALAAQRHLELRVDERRARDAAVAAVARSRARLRRHEVAVDEARLRLDRMVIRAPIDGFIQRRLKVPGDKVMLGMDTLHSSHLAHLYDPSQLQVRVDVPLADAAHVFTGQRCEVIVDVLPDQAFAGEVTRVTHEADLQKNTLQVKVRVIDPSPLLRPEMLTRVKFLPGGPEGAAAPDGGGPAGGARAPTRQLVPESSLVVSADGATSVWVVRSRRGNIGVVEPVAVEVIGEEAGWARVRGPLQPGDLLAVDAPPLDSGQRVRMVRGGAS